MIMKISTLFFLSACLTASAKSSSQINLFENKASLQKVFKQIKKQSGYNFLYRYELLENAGTVTVKVNNATLNQALDVVLEEKQLTYEIIDNTVIIKKKESEILKDAFLPDRIVTGKVTDDNGDPMQGVSVVIKGTTTGTTTDKNGNYKIQMPDKGVLVFSSVDYITLEVPTNDRLVVDVKLLPSQKEIDQVVVIGYGTQKRRDVTGNISRISAKSIKDVPMVSFDQALSGRAAGVNFTIPNGVLGNPAVIRIRGINSISLSSFPLVVVDGIPIWSGDVGSGFAANNALADINPSDIESFEVLKDAAATAIYGSRAAAGVILITTKRGKAGKAKVNLESWVSATKAMNLIEMLNAEEYTMIKNEALLNAGTPANGTTRGFYTMNDANGKLVDTRWYDEAYRTGLSSNHSLNISGANETTQYFFSLGYSNQQGIFYTNDFNRKTGRFTLDHKVNNRINIGGSFNYTQSMNKGLITGTPTEARPEAVFAAAGAARLAMILPPNVGPYKNDGSWNYNGFIAMGQGNNITPLSFLPNFKMAMALNTQTSQSDRVMSNAYIGIKLIKGMEFKSIYGVDNLLVENKEFRNALHSEGSRFGGAASNIMSRFQRSNWQNLLNYNTTINQKHQIGILVGAEQQSSSRNSWGADRRIVADSLYNIYQGSFGTIFPFGNVVGINFLQSYFSRVNYDYKKKYYLSLSARRDGYSAFALGKKFGNFGGASIGWVLSQEDFFKNSSMANTINFLQLRASYGKVGNNLGIADFASQNLYSSGLNGPNNTLFFSQAGNQNLTWETSRKIDMGFSFGLLNNRITGEVAYYKNNIDGLILGDPQSPSAGIPGNAILNNIGGMFNKGWEFTVNANVVRNKNFNWNTSLNFTTQRNEITSLAAGNSDIILVTAVQAPFSIARVGESLGSFYVVKSGAVNPANGRRIFYYRDGTAVQFDASAPSSALRWTYLDGSPAPRSPNQNQDGVVMGPALPKWFGGFDNNFRYKAFDMNILLFFSGGNYMFNGTKTTIRSPTTANSDKAVLTRWQKPGDVTNIPRLVYGDLISNGSTNFITSESVEKADFVKVRNISLGYTMPGSLTDKIGLSRVRFYAAALNAFVFTKYTGFDPEISTNRNSTGTPSVELNSAPMSRSFSFGVNIGF